MPDALHTVTLSDFVNMWPAPEDVVARYYDHRAPIWAKSLGVVLARRRGADLPCPVDGYRMTRVRDRGTDTIVAVQVSSGAIAGAVTHYEFHVWPEHRGRGLGVELLDQAFVTGIKTRLNTSGHGLSPGALACRRAVHRRFVERALGRGLEVPDQVLEDYPDLVETATPAP